MASSVGLQPKVVKKSVTAAGTAEVVSTTSVVSAGIMTVQANPDNTGFVYVGDSSCDNTYPALAPAASITLPGDFDLNNLWVDADTNGDGIRILRFA